MTGSVANWFALHTEPATLTVERFALLYEGEGSLVLTSRRANTAKRSVQMTLGMIDKDIVDCVRDTFGGTLCVIERPERKPIYQWSLMGVPAMVLAWRMYPYLFSRRREQIGHVINGWCECRRPHDPQLDLFRQRIEALLRDKPTLIPTPKPPWLRKRLREVIPHVAEPNAEAATP